MLFSFKHVRFIQKLYIQELNFIQKLLFIKQLCRNEQSRDRTIPADKNRRTAAHVTCRLKEKLFKK